MIRLSDAGWSAPRIAEHLGVHAQTVRGWLKAFQAHGEHVREGFDALADRPHLGKPSAVTPEMLAGVKALLSKRERTWTAQQVAEWAAQEYGVSRSAKQWRRLLRRIGQSYKRTGRSLRHKQNPPAVQAAKEEMAALQEQAQMPQTTQTPPKGAAKSSAEGSSGGWTCATWTKRAWR